MSQKSASEPTVNASATRSLMFGLWSLLCGPFTGLHAVVIGFRSLREITQSKGAQQGKGRAVAGIATGIFTSIVTLVVVGVVLFSMVMSGVQGIAQNWGALLARVDLQGIGAAFHLYHDKHKVFPVVDNSDEMRQALSWRVRILPHLDEASLYGKFDLGAGWDSPTNRPLAAERPGLYTPRFMGFSTEGTNYLAVVNADKDDPARVGIQTHRGMESPANFGRISDGTSNTIVVVVADKTTQQGPWTMGYDLEVDLQNPAVGLQEIDGYYLVLLADGSTQEISKDIDPEVLADLMDRADGRSSQIWSTVPNH